MAGIIAIPGLPAGKHPCLLPQDRRSWNGQFDWGKQELAIKGLVKKNIPQPGKKIEGHCQGDIEGSQNSDE